MVKNLEQYLSDLDFDLPENQEAPAALGSAERVFVEKYLGLDALPSIPRIDPPAAATAQILLKPRPVLPVIEVAPDPGPYSPDPPPAAVDEPESEVAPSAKQLAEPAPVRQARLAQEGARAQAALAPELPVIEVVAQAESIEISTPTAPASQPVVTTAEETAPIASAGSAAAVTTAERTAQVASPVAAPESTEEIPQLPSLRDLARDRDEIQVVSFFVAGQLFLLPVGGIQEVLRHMELVKVPKAPEYVAGVINLRGHITPLVHLSALVTNSQDSEYDDSKFVIIYGADDSRLGLIIDRISSMHMLPQDKIIWNVESKVGDAAECLAALANLDGRVCGIVAPDIIFQKMFAS